MIDFRYHIVSIVAVFLALGLGLLVGATALQPTALGGLISLSQREHQQIGAALATNRQLNRQLDTILPGDTIAYPLILRHDLKPATYAVRAHASCARSTAEANAALVLHSALRGTPTHSVAPAQTVVKITHSGLPTWLVAGLAGVAAVSGAAAGWVLRQRRKPV